MDVLNDDTQPIVIMTGELNKIRDGLARLAEQVKALKGEIDAREGAVSSK